MMPSRALCALPLFCAVAAVAGPKLSYDDGTRSLEIAGSAQVWAAGTYDPYNSTSGTKVDPRADIYLRRLSLAFKGQAYTDLSYQISLEMDNVGKDSLTGLIGGPQNSNPTGIQIYDAFFGWKAFGDYANVTFGIFRPVLSRSLITSATSLTSLDNSLGYSYERDALFTQSTARASGVNMGGQYVDTTHAFAVGYDAGVFDPFQDKNSATATPTASPVWSPMFTGRLSVTYGDPESKSYTTGRSDNSLGARNGITLGGFASWQGPTSLKIDSATTISTTGKGATKTSGMAYDTVLSKTTYKYLGGFRRNAVYGGDVFAEFHRFTFDAEAAWLYRSFYAGDVALMAAKKIAAASDYTDFTWHVRAAYAIPVGKTFIEPSAMFTRFDADDQSILYPDGTDRQIDLGINWYLQKNNVKVSLHWIGQDGDVSSYYQSKAVSGGTLRMRDDCYVAAVQLNY